MANEQLQQAIEIAKKQILEKLAKEEPYLFGEGGLYHQVKSSPNGKKTFTIWIKDGFVTDLIQHTSVHKKFTKEP